MKLTSWPLAVTKVARHRVTLNPLVAGSNPARVTGGATTVTFVETPQLVTPVTWLMMPDLLSIPQACHLAGVDEATMRWMIADGAVEAVDGEDDYLIDKDSLEVSMETLAELMHWED